MKVITWNVRKSKKDSVTWGIIQAYDPDIMLLQEVYELPDTLLDQYQSVCENPKTKTGKNQVFKTFILCKGTINSKLKLTSDYTWVNNEYSYFSGNIVGYEVTTQHNETYNVISTYIPAWPVQDERLEGIDFSTIRLENHLLE